MLGASDKVYIGGTQSIPIYGTRRFAKLDQRKERLDMSVTSTTSAFSTVAESGDPVLDELYQQLNAARLAPLWTMAQELMTTEPEPSAVPWLWKADTLRTLAERAGELVTIDRGGDRRVLSIVNPGLSGLPYATPTLWGAVQYLNPGEHAGAHRHTPGAIRFVLEGSGVFTTVNGDACDMRPGDLILTPSWTWHDHNSESSEAMLWFDGLDLPTVAHFDAIFFEQLPNELLQEVEQRNGSEHLYHKAGLLPIGATHQDSSSPLLAYRREDTDAALNALLERSHEPMVSLEYVNPVTGEPALPTMGCEMHRLLPGKRTRTRRETGSSVFVVFSGAGSSVINEEKFDWETGDIVVVPSWANVDHESSEISDLFSINDTPLLRVLGLHRSLELESEQPVGRVFQSA